jgi:hypothetical protein
MRNNFSINIISVIVNSLIPHYIVIEDSYPSRKLRIVRFLFDREVSEIDIFTRNTFNGINISNYDNRMCRMCRIRSGVNNAGYLLIVTRPVCTI